jgi:hypothetical protein
MLHGGSHNASSTIPSPSAPTYLLPHSLSSLWWRTHTFPMNSPQKVTCELVIRHVWVNCVKTHLPYGANYYNHCWLIVITVICSYCCYDCYLLRRRCCCVTRRYYSYCARFKWSLIRREYDYVRVRKDLLRSGNDLFQGTAATSAWTLLENNLIHWKRCAFLLFWIPDDGQSP